MDWSQFAPLITALLLAVGGRAVAWVKDQLDASTYEDLQRAERYARDAAAWAIVHGGPNATPDALAAAGAGELAKILDNVGLKLDDTTRGHLAAVLQGFIAQHMLPAKPAS
jgi:hypothetical protein